MLVKVQLIILSNPLFHANPPLSLPLKLVNWRFSRVKLISSLILKYPPLLWLIVTVASGAAVKVKSLSMVVFPLRT